MDRIGFIGTGVMGASMVKNLLKNNFTVSVYNRTPEKARSLVQDGAVFADTIKACVQDADIIITIVGLPNDVEEVATLVFEHAKKDSILIDMTTSSPALAEKLAKQGKEIGIHMLDAPVSGGDIGAKNGTLSIMVGGDFEVFKLCTPVFECMGNNVVYCGASGKGQHTKMANQIAIAGAVSGVTEAITYSNTMGLDPMVMLNAISAGAAGSWQMSNNGPKMIHDDFEPGFFIKHFVKDMNIALQCSESKSLDLPVLKIVCDMYQEMIEHAEGDLGTQALIQHYKRKI